MNLKIRHQTFYRYDQEVFLEPHHLYFNPLQRPFVQVNNFTLEVTPEPAGIAPRIDAENNGYYQCWFLEKHRQLEVDIMLEVELKEHNPFNFLIENGRRSTNDVLGLYTEKEALSVQMEEWVNERLPTGKDHVAFALKLSQDIHAGWDHAVRYEADLHTPGWCFENKSGSCRDLSWMLIHMLRNQGIPARFVSGYAYNSDLGEGHELHAWVELWVDGAGWIGVDPSSGLLAYNYLAVVASYHPKYTFPVQGTFRGSAQASLDFRVRIEEM